MGYSAYFVAYLAEVHVHVYTMYIHVYMYMYVLYRANRVDMGTGRVAVTRETVKQAGNDLITSVVNVAHQNQQLLIWSLYITHTHTHTHSFLTPQSMYQE